MNIKVGDRVRYVAVDSDKDKASGYYPPIGTLGTVLKVLPEAYLTNIEVRWDEGTAGDGIWWCYSVNVELVTDPEVAS